MIHINELPSEILQMVFKSIFISYDYSHPAFSDVWDLRDEQMFFVSNVCRKWADLLTNCVLIDAAGDEFMLYKGIVVDKHYR